MLLNNGDGTLGSAAKYVRDGSSKFVISADLDGDGATDLPYFRYSSNTIEVLKNDGTGEFSQGSSTNVGATANRIAAADMDGDGLPDLILTISNGQKSGYVSVLRNNGDGTFAARINYNVGFSSPGELMTADLDSDGDTDIVAASGAQDYSLAILENNGDGTLGDPVALSACRAPRSIAAADLNGDGATDLAVACTLGESVSVFLNKGDGTFASPVDYPMLNQAVCIALYDLNLDSYPDLVVGIANGNYKDTTTFIALRNRGDGAFGDELDYFADMRPVGLYVGPLYSDGGTGILSADYYATIVRNRSISSAPDCNQNDQPDECDIADGTSRDDNADGVPDECQNPLHRGDTNCDGAVDFNDIDPFVTALISRADYESQYPDCNWLNGDINADESVDFNDIDGFVECLINGGCE